LQTGSRQEDVPTLGFHEENRQETGSAHMRVEAAGAENNHTATATAAAPAVDVDAFPAVKALFPALGVYEVDRLDNSMDTGQKKTVPGDAGVL
jgi:hypothetical protein